jgi:hypothetical protein
MCWICNPIGTTADTISHWGDVTVDPLVERVKDQGINLITDPIEQAGQKIYDVADKTWTAIKTDPIGTLLPVAVSYLSYGAIPPYVTAAAVGAARGKNIGEIATQAIISMGAQGLSEYTFGTGTSLNDITTEIGQALGGDYSILANSITSGLNNATFNGVLALAQGKNVRDAITSGFTAGALTSGVNSLTSEGLSYFKDAQDGSWGFSGDQLKLVQGGMNTALIAGLSGQDIGKAITAYATRAAYQSAKGKTAEFLSSTADKATEAIKNYTTAVGKAQAQEVLLQNAIYSYSYNGNTIQSLEDSLQNEANNFITYKKLADEAAAAGDYATQNEYAELANTSAANYERYDTQLTDAKAAVLSSPEYLANKDVLTGLTNKAIQADPTEAITNLSTAQQQYDTAISEAATKQFLIDQINTGNLAPLNYDKDSGIYDFGEGLTYNGQDFYQNGEKIFANTSDFEFAPVNIQGTPDIPATEDTGGTFVQMEPAQPQAIYVPADDGAEEEPQTVEFTEEDAPVEEDIDWMNVGDEGGVEDVEGEEGIDWDWINGIKIPKIPVSTTPKPAPKPAPAPAPEPAATSVPTASTQSPQNLAALLALFDQPQQQQEPVQDPYAHIQSPMGDLFGSTLNVNAAQGGSINDLLRILRG